MTKLISLVIWMIIRLLMLSTYIFLKLLIYYSIPHDKLISRLNEHGVRCDILKWTADFLADWNQMVRISNSKSNLLPVSSGVIQGSVLFPFLFRINKIDVKLDYCHILKYADDAEHRDLIFSSYFIYRAYISYLFNSNLRQSNSA